MSGTGRGQKSQPSSAEAGPAGESGRAACVLLGEQLRCCGAPQGDGAQLGAGRGWGRSILLSVELEDLIPRLQQGGCRQKAPVQLQGSPWLSCSGSEEAAWFGTWCLALICRVQAEMKAISWPCPGDWWLSASHAHAQALGPFCLFSSTVPCYCIALDSSALRSASAWLIYLCKSQTAAGTIPFWWPGRAGRGAQRRLPAAWICAVIRVAPDKSRAGISLWGVLDHVSVPRRSSPGLLAAVGLQTTTLNSPRAPLLC